MHVLLKLLIFVMVVGCLVVEGGEVNEEECEDRIFSQLALAHYRDQNDYAAFFTFAEGLEGLLSETALVSSSKIYKEALASYFKEEVSSSRNHAVVFCKRFAGIADESPDDDGLNLLVAMAYAHLGMFDQVFERCYDACRRSPGHWIGHKMCALFHFKLRERVADSEVRNFHREKAYAHLKLAQKISRKVGEKDPSLYRFCIVFALPEEKSRVVKEQVSLIVEEDLPLPRKDLPFYIQVLVESGEISLGEKLVERAKGWYEYSRSVAIAATVLENAKKRQSVNVKGG